MLKVGLLSGEALLGEVLLLASLHCLLAFARNNLLALLLAQRYCELLTTFELDVQFVTPLLGAFLVKHLD